MTAGATLVHVLDDRAQHRPDRLAFRFLSEGRSDGPSVDWTYGVLAAHTNAVAAALTERRLAGERVLLLYPSGLPFVAAFLGCLRAGALAVPAYPPDPARLARTLPVFGRAPTRNRDQHHRAAPGCLPDAAGHFVAGKARHADVQQRGIGLIVMCDRHRLDAIDCDLHVVALQAQDRGQRLGRVAVVVGDQNPARRALNWTC